jgi:hypothetical protein
MMIGVSLPDQHTIRRTDRPSEGVNQKRTRPQNEPGTKYEYNDTRVNVLALALLNVWRKPLPVVLKEKIIESFESQAGKNKSNLLSYFMTHRLKNLSEHISDF